MRAVRNYLEELKSSSHQDYLNHCYQGLSDQQKTDLSSRDIQVYTGKIRDMVYQGDEVQVVHSDRLTAFDRLIGYIPYKGTILTAISSFWFEQVKDVVPTHYLGRTHERILRVERRTPVKAEVIVRGYLAGSMMRAYETGERTFCGVTLPEGLKPYAKLPEPIITPTTKAAAFDHDEDIGADEIIDRGIATKAEWSEISDMALTLFAHGSKTLADKDWILVDTKYEFGRSAKGDIAVIDEIHTPDSSRFWQAKTYETNLSQGKAPDMLDKELVRRWLLDKGFKGHGDVPKVPQDVLIDLARVYLDVARTLSGEEVQTEGPKQKVQI